MCLDVWLNAFGTAPYQHKPWALLELPLQIKTKLANAKKIFAAHRKKILDAMMLSSNCGNLTCREAAS